MILLGINCGFGNHDCGTLPKSAIDLEAGWVNYPRPKTAIERRCPLWPETIEAIREAIEAATAAKSARARRSGVHHEVRPTVGKRHGRSARSPKNFASCSTSSSCIGPG